MPTATQRGYAMIEGVEGTVAALAYPVKQSAKIGHNFEEEIVKDENGFDAGWLYRNEHFMVDIGCKLAASTTANRALITNALTIGSCITLAGFSNGSITGGFNGGYQVLSGGEMSYSNTGVGDVSYKLRRYSNSTQNTSGFTAAT